jgi:peptidoglycan hydrolase-like protein with peptidoglycan-binding domain
MHGKRIAIAIAAVVCCTMVFGTVSVSAASATLQREAEGSNVKALQKDLIRLGYLSTEATGYYGNATEVAVKQLQKEYGYEADGIAGSTTLSLLDRLLGRTKTAAVSGAASARLLQEGDESSSVAEMQKKLIKLGYLNTKATGFYGSATTSAVKKLQGKYGYETDGIAGSSTLTLLTKLANGEKVNSAAKTAAKTTAAVKTAAVATAVVKAAPAAAALEDENSQEDKASQEDADSQDKDTQDEEAAQEEETETTTQSNFMPPWFGNVENTFAIGETATVYDIKSGLSFKIKRTYGHNHADCEALTAKDTAIMKKIYSGKWSWERRAIIVSVDGLKLAACMTGMPHAGLDKYSANKTVSSRSGGFGRGTNLDKVKNNNMNGVFDIHFYKSKNHYNNKVDPKHQALVKYAAEWAEEHYKKAK